MLFFYPVTSNQEIHRKNPLHISFFFSLTGMSWKKRKQRQGLILSIAFKWWQITNRNTSAPWFIEEECYLTALTAQDVESRRVLEYFFTIEQKGFNFGSGNKQATKIKPNKLGSEIITAIVNLQDDLKYQPPQLIKTPSLVKSIVYIQNIEKEVLFLKLKRENKEHFLPLVKWLLDQKNPVEFYYEYSGNLKSRLKSVWPIQNIEGWPGWLRRELFGTNVDIENAYIQFLVTHLKDKYSNEQFKLMYPELLRLYKNKSQYRFDICEKYLYLPKTPENIKYVKSLIMSISNGSKISGKMVEVINLNSDAVRIIHEANPNLTTEQRYIVGEKLNFLCKQIKSAKKDLCRQMNLKGNSDDQKLIFQNYLKWEKSVRLKLWDETDGTGVNSHDGLDGVVVDTEIFVKNFYDKYQVEISLD